jgi:integrase
MAYAWTKENKKGTTVYVRWKRGRGDYPTATCDEHGQPFRNEREAKKWGQAQEADVRRGLYKDPRAGEITLAEWVQDRWWPAFVEGLKRKTRDNYRYVLELHILPQLGPYPLNQITPAQVAEWEQGLRKDGYADNTVRNARARLMTLLGDAVVEGLIDANPADRPRRRGRVRRPEAEEKVWATPLQTLLLAERCALLSGRDDDFVFPLVLGYLGLRWGEGIGIQHDAVSPGIVRVRSQLGEDDLFYLETPKDESLRTLDVPPFLSELLSELKKQRHDVTCRCSNPDDVPDACPGGLRFVFLGDKGGHFRASNYRDRVWYPAVHGWYPGNEGKRPRPARPVLADASGIWPGKPVPTWPAAVAGEEFVVPRGRGIRIYDPEVVHLVSWLPLVPGLTPHGLRHSQQVWMDQLGTLDKLQADRMGHKVGGIRWAYKHVPPEDREELKDGLQRLWKESLAERFAISPRSPVATLDALLEPLRKAAGKRRPVQLRARPAQVRRLRRAVHG